MQLLPGNRILLAEEEEQRVTERDLRGKIGWQIQNSRVFPRVCQRLANGNTFIVGPGAPAPVDVLEVTSKGAVVYEGELGDLEEGVILEDKQIDGVEKLANGRIVYGFKKGLIHEIESLTGPKAKTVSVKDPKAEFPLECLPGGHYLLRFSEGIGEVDSTGRTVWQYPGGRLATRLRNGNTLLEGKDRLLEVDRAGKTVWEAPVAGDKMVRLRKCLNLVRFGFDHGLRPGVDFDSVSYRARFLKSKNVFGRRLSARDLAELGPEARPVLPVLIQTLADPDEKVREAVKDALRSVGPAAIPGLLGALKDKQATIREGAVIVLGRLGPLARPAAAELLKALRDENREVRAAAVYALVSQPEAKTVEKQLVAHLAADLKEVKSEICYEAVQALAALGKKSKAARGALLAGLKHPWGDLRLDTVHALGDLSRIDARIGPALIEFLKDRCPKAYWKAAEILAQIAPKQAIPILLADLKAATKTSGDRTREIGRQAAFALHFFGKEAQIAIPSLIPIVKNQKADRRFREAAAMTLGCIGPAARAALPALTKMAREEDEVLAETAKRAVAKIRREGSAR
jgi:HEAT repeat protein